MRNIGKNTFRIINWIAWFSIIAFGFLGILFLWLPANRNALMVMRLVSPFGNDFRSIKIYPNSPNFSSIYNYFSIQAPGSSLRLSCFHQGQIEFWQEDYSKVIEILNNCSGEKESYLKNMILGEAYWMSGLTGDAVRVWRRVPAINSYFWQQAGVAEKNGNYELLEEFHYKMMQISPDWQPAEAGYWYAKSMLYLQSSGSSQDEYQVVIEKAIDFNVDSGGRQLQLGAELYKKHEYELAERCLVNAKNLEPHSRWVYYYLGLVYYRTERYPQAIVELEDTLKIDSEFGNAYYYIAQSYKKLGRLEIAFAYMQEALRLSPENSSYQTGMKAIEQLVQGNTE